VFCDGGFVSAETLQSQRRAARALVIVSRVVKVFGGDEEKRFVGVEVAYGFDEIVRRRSRRSEGEIALAVVLERFVGHDRAEIRAAITDVDDVADALAGLALHAPLRTLSEEGGHLVQHGMDAGTTSRHRRGSTHPSARAVQREARRDLP